MPVAVVQCIAKLELGGAQKRVIELLKETGKDGYLITGEGGRLYKDVLDEFGSRHITLSHLKRELSLFHEVLCFFELRNVLIGLHKRYDKVILHTHGSKAGVLGRIVSGGLSFCYSIHTIHGFAINPFVHPLKRFIYLNAERISSLFGDFIITQARVHIDRAIRWGIGKRGSFKWIPNAIKYQEFEPSKRENADRLVIGTIGNMKPQKNPLIWAEVALKVTSLFSNVFFLYIGDGHLREKVEEMISGEMRIKLLGWRDNVPEILSGMDIFFLPSRWEGLPRTVLESMASGLPVVASAVDGTKEAVLDSITGYLVSPDDIDGYVDRLTELIKDEEKRRMMGMKGRERVVRYFSYDWMIQQTLGVYRAISRGEALPRLNDYPVW
ncbi:glycosyltransferase family 4 protein [candidate division WOR-3 bacterium]|nr:glycosyltransferase family 4 protein [candidate division WOR-3 bacterium]